MKRTHFSSLHQLFFYLLAITLTISACKKGDTGPQGEKGDKGDTGATGATGAKGDAGTANVQYSPWIDVTFSLNQAQTLFIANIAQSKITEAILSNGEIRVYLNFGTAAAKDITVLPFRSGTQQIIPFFQVGNIELNANVNASTTTDPTSGAKVLQYRYVIIPGGAAVRANTHIDWNNYEEVKNYLGLKD